MKTATFVMHLLSALPLVLYAALFHPLTILAGEKFSSWSTFSPEQRGAALGCLAILFYPVVFVSCVILAGLRRKRLRFGHAFWISCIPVSYLGAVVAFFATWDVAYQK